MWLICIKITHFRLFSYCYPAKYYKMRTISAKPSNSSNPVKPTKLGTKMKAGVKVGSRTDIGTPREIQLDTSSRDFDSVVRKNNMNPTPFNTTLPPRWISACVPSNFKFAKDLKSSSFVDVGPKHSTPAQEPRIRSSKERTLKAKSGALLLDSQISKVSKQVEKPRLYTSSNVQFVQKLKQKDLEILNLKQKLWLRDSRQMMAPRSKSNVVDVLGAYGLKGRESVNFNSKPVSNNNHVQQKLISQEISSLRSKLNKKDEEVKALKEENMKLNKRLERNERELDALRHDLGNKDHEMLGALMDKNQEILLLKQEKCQSEEDVKKQTLLSAETQKHTDEAVITTESDSDDTKELENLTAQFLEKISASICRGKYTRVKASSKDNSIKIQVKVTVRGDKGIKLSNLSSMSDTFNDSPCRLTKAIKDITEEAYRESSDVD